MFESATVDQLVNNLVRRLYGKQLVRNVLRGELVEQMLLDALGSSWREASDYESWDLVEIATGNRIQVKQSAAWQTWSSPDSRASRPSFSIDLKAGYSNERKRWVEPRQRRCELYVFGWHPVVGLAADHRLPEQWEFYVVSAADLPTQASIGLAGLNKLVQPCGYGELASCVELTLR